LLQPTRLWCGHPFVVRQIGLVVLATQMLRSSSGCLRHPMGCRVYVCKRVHRFRHRVPERSLFPGECITSCARLLCWCCCGSILCGRLGGSLPTAAACSIPSHNTPLHVRGTAVAVASVFLHPNTSHVIPTCCERPTCLIICSTETVAGACLSAVGALVVLYYYALCRTNCVMKLHNERSDSNLHDMSVSLLGWLVGH
jgi:hypothetical protein